MANQNLSNQIFALVERESITFHQKTAHEYTWRMAGVYAHCRSGHLFSVCLALKALRSPLVTDDERREITRQLQADIRFNCFNGDADVANRWMQFAGADARHGAFREALVAWDVEQSLRSRPKKPAGTRPARPATTPHAETAEMERMIQTIISSQFPAASPKAA